MKYVLENDVPIHKLVVITTKWGTGDVRCALWFYCSDRNDPAFPDFMSYHCIIHQQALVGKVVDLSHVVTLVVR